MKRICTVLVIIGLVFILLAGSHHVATANEKYVISLYVPGFLKDGPAWRTQVDRMRMQYTGDSAEDHRREMMMAKEAGIDAFAYNSFPSNMAQEVVEMKTMADLAQKVGFKIVPFPAASMSQSFDFKQGCYALKEVITNFVNHPAVLRVDGKMLILIDSADYIPFSGWQELFSALKRDYPEEMSKVVFVAQLRNINASDDDLKHYLQLGFSGFLDLYGNSSAGRLRGIVDSVIPDGKGIVMGTMDHGFYWRVEYGATSSQAGTEILRNNWEHVGQLPIDFVHLMSWNDFSENHHFAPSQYLGKIRSEVSRYYADRMNQRPSPVYDDYHLYYSFRRSLLMGEALDVELLNLPNSKGNYFASCEVRLPSGELFKDLESSLITANALQAVKVSIPTAALPSGTRYVELWGVIKNQDGKEVLRKKIGFVILEPIINRNYLAMSRLITDIPDVDLQVTRKDDTITLSSSSTKALRDLHLMRSDFIQVRHGARKEMFVKVLFAGTRTYDANGQGIMSNQEGSIAVSGGKILRAETYSVIANGATSITRTGSKSLTFKSKTDGWMYPEGIILGLTGSEKTSLDVVVNGHKFTLTIQDLKRHPASYMFDVSTMLSICMTDEDTSLFSPAPRQTLKYDIADMTPSSSLIWWDTPVEPFFARAMTTDRRWVDSSPIILNHGQSNKMLNGYGFDAVSKSRFPITFYEDEKLVADWDFSKVSPTGTIPSQSGYDYRAAFGGSADLLVPFPRFVNNPPMNPVLVQDSMGQVAEFDGVGNFVYGPVSVFPSEGFHLTIMVKPERTDVLQSLFSDKRFNGSGGTAALYVLPGGTVQGQVHSTGNWTSLSGKTTLVPDQWYKIELVYDLATLSLYVNGNLESSMDMAATQLPLGDHPTIGAEEKFADDFQNYFKGRIAFARIEAYSN